ncbi:pyruvate kinase, partial [Flavobacteriaceae bacterium]|nr:pyruvate kinase [Flavobacteriaceae bacterium]
MPNQKKTKIVATLGPATADKKILKQMILEGVNVFRVNFSHAKYDTVKQIIALIREL